MRSPTEPQTYAELEAMHSKIVQKCTQLIEGFSALDIYELTWVEHNLREIKDGFRKDYERNDQDIKFFKIMNKQRPRLRPRALSREAKGVVKSAAKGWAKGRKKK